MRVVRLIGAGLSLSQSSEGLTGLRHSRDADEVVEGAVVRSVSSDVRSIGTNGRRSLGTADHDMIRRAAPARERQSHRSTPFVSLGAMNCPWSYAYETLHEDDLARAAGGHKRLSCVNEA